MKSRYSKSRKLLWNWCIDVLCFLPSSHFLQDANITIDESSKDNRTFQCRYGRGIKGQDIPHPDVFVHGERYTLIAAISMAGYLATCVIPGSCDSFQFFDFIVEDVVSHMFCCFVSGRLTHLFLFFSYHK